MRCSSAWCLQEAWGEDGDVVSLPWWPWPHWSGQALVAPPYLLGSGTDLWYISVWLLGSGPVSLYTGAPCPPEKHHREALAVCVQEFQELRNQSTPNPPS